MSCNVNTHALVRIYLLYNPTLVHIHSNFDSIHAPHISTKSFNYHLIPKLSIGLTILFIAVFHNLCIYFCCFLNFYDLTTLEYTLNQYHVPVNELQNCVVK
jgi:LmbE family N-acetylglucosaminyl deacetylase